MCEEGQQKASILKIWHGVNPLFPNASFLYPQKTEHLTVFCCFQGVENGCIGNEWVNVG